MNSRYAYPALLALALATSAVVAQTVTVTGGPEVVGIGDTLDSGFDKFKFNNGSFEAVFNTPFVVTTYDFTVGPNHHDWGAVIGSASFSLSALGYGPINFDVPFLWTGGFRDTILFGPTVTPFTYAGHSYWFKTFAFGSTSAIESVKNGNLYGEIFTLHPGTTAPVPEPETYALMLAGLGAIGFLQKRRRAA